MITLELYGTPIALKRPRFSTRGKFPKAYDSQSKLKETFQWQLKSQYRDELLTIPMALDLIFFMPIPTSSSKIQKRQMKNGVLPHMKRPDIDNLIKMVLDCLNNCIIKDDSQICEIRAKKIYSEKPGTLIRMIPLADDKRKLLYENCSREN